jgi:DUF971 family protein
MTAEPDDRFVPDDIDITRDRDVTVVFADGERALFEVSELRSACPCASCRGWRERGEIAWPRPGQADSIAIVHAELAGAFGLSIDWSDGHSTGIYSWRALRRWWDADMALPFVVDPSPEPHG